jgi:hypothetical protein
MLLKIYVIKGGLRNCPNTITRRLICGESRFAEKGDVSVLREKIPWDTKYGWLVCSIQNCTQPLYLGRVLVISKNYF